MITEPGEVIACPPAGPKSSFQIAAGPERIEREPYLCTYFSLHDGDGADTCFDTDSAEGGRSLVRPLMTIRADQSGRLAVAGIVGDDVAAVAIAPGAGISREKTVIPIDRRRGARLGATRAFGYFSLTVDDRTLCADERPRVLGRDSTGRRIAESTVPLSTPLLSAADRVPYAGSLKALCGSRGSSEPVEVGWLTELGAVLQSLLRALI